MDSSDQLLMGFALSSFEIGNRKLLEQGRKGMRQGCCMLMSRNVDMCVCVFTSYPLTIVSCSIEQLSGVRQALDGNPQ